MAGARAGVPARRLRLRRSRRMRAIMFPASWRACAWIVLLAGATFARADAPASVFLEDLTSPELAQRIGAGATTVLVPIGGTEQNGPHMTLGKHNVRARLLAERIARELGNALVAPVVAYVPEGRVDAPAGHMRFPGTITVPTDAFEKTLESIARSLARAGFRDIVLIGDHGGYQPSMQAVAQRLDREWAKSPSRVHALVEYYRAADTAWRRALAAQGHSEAEIGTHAGLADTSLSLAVDPRLVRADKLKDAPRAADGTYGDPRASTAALGEPGVNAIVAASVEAIRKAVRR